MLVNANCDNGFCDADSCSLRGRVNQTCLVGFAYHNSPEIVIMKNYFPEDSRSQLRYSNLNLSDQLADPLISQGVKATFHMTKIMCMKGYRCSANAQTSVLICGTNIIFTLKHFVTNRKGLEKGALLWFTDPPPTKSPSPPQPCKLLGLGRSLPFFLLESQFFPWAVSKFPWHGGRG